MIDFGRAWPLCLLLLNCVAAKRYYITRWGACDDCGKHDGTGYNWCRLGYKSSDWDYCSTTGGYTTRDEECITDCGQHGESYMWCYTAKSWDYCSRVEDNSVTYFTTKNKECSNYCDILEAGTGKFECRTSDQHSYDCSPFQGITSGGKECAAFTRGQENRPNGDCLQRGYSYFWCNTANTWDYCSPLESFAANSLQPRGEQRLSALSPRNPPTDRPFEIIQSNVESLRGGRRLTTYVVLETEATPKLRDRNDQSDYDREDAERVIFNWRNKGVCFYCKTQGTLQNTATVRLDLQGYFNHPPGSDVRFANLQLQINGRQVRQPSSIAQASVEIGRGSEMMDFNVVAQRALTALHASLRHARKTWVFQELTDARGNLLDRSSYQGYL